MSQAGFAKVASIYTVKQVAEILGYSTNSIYTFLKEGRLRGVRIGRGRFRIPEDEVDALLTLKGQAAIVPLTGTAPLKSGSRRLPRPRNPSSFTDFLETSKNTLSESVADAVRGNAPLPTVISVPILGKLQVKVASIFDWFVGVGALVAGAAMYVYNQSFNIANVQVDLPIVPAIRIIVTGGGLGIILANLFQDHKSRWLRAYKILIIVSGSLMVLYFVKSGDIDGAAVYGLIILVMILSLVLPVGGSGLFGIYLSLLAIAAPLVLYLAPTDLHAITFYHFLNNPPPNFTLVLLAALVLIFLISFWYGYLRSRFIFAVSSWAAGGVIFLMSFFYGLGQYWSRAFLFIVIGLTTLLLPVWERLTLTKSKKVQVLTVGILVAILGLLLGAIGIVGLIQLNIRATIESENLKKVKYAADYLDSAVMAVKTTIADSANSPDLAKAVEAGDKDALAEISRTIFVGNRNLRRVVILDKNGRGISLYPLGTFDEIDLSFIDYYLVTRRTYKPYISDVFEALVDQSHRKVIAVAAPILDANGNFQGVLAGSVNIDRMSFELQKIALPGRGEFFEVIDSKAKFMIHPQKEIIGTEAKASDPILKSKSNSPGIVEIVSPEGAIDIMVYARLSDLNWGMGLVTPVAQIYVLTVSSCLIMLVVIALSVAMGTLMLQFASSPGFRRRRPETGGGP